MVTINLAYTAPINAFGAFPVLSQSQVWAGLKRKVRNAQEFVPLIVACEVLSETEAEKGFTVVRQVKFKEGQGPNGDGKPVKEVCVHYAPCRVDFEQENGSTISNVVSTGPDGELMMTYAFEWRHPSVAAGSPDAKTLEEAHTKVGVFLEEHWNELL
jgi:hypothetical protein